MSRREQMRAGLGAAVAALHRSRLASAAVGGAERAIANALWLAFGFMVVHLGLRVVGGVGLSFGVALAGLMLVTLPPIGFGLWSASRAMPTPSEAAERLDLQLNSNNRIATATELLGAADQSPLAEQAIAQGLGLLRQAADVVLKVPVRKLKWRQSGRRAAVTVLFFIIAAVLHGFVSMQLDPSQHPSLALTPPINASSAVAPEVGRAPSERRPVDATQRPAATLIADSATSPGGSLLSDSHESAASSDSGGAAGQLSASSNPSAGNGNQNGNTDQSTSKRAPNGSHSGAKASTPQKPQRPDPAASDGAGQTPGSKPPPSGSEQKSAPIQAGDSKDGSKPDGGSAKGGNGPPPAGSKPGEGGEGSGGEGGAPPKGASGNSEVGSTADIPSGGNGRTPGQNALKKSRGVAPLLLGTPQPDLLEGRQLDGPEERTKRRIPPTHDPSEPQTNALPAPRQGVEPTVNRYEVPGELQRAVGDYFRSFHKDADPR